jgi:hypothetical protein
MDRTPVPEDGLDPSAPADAPDAFGGERWLDAAAGPVVRPYAMTRGRTVPSGIRLDLVTILVATGRRQPEHVRISPEQRRLLLLAGRFTTVADLASEVDLPLGVVRVLLGDLIQHGLLAIQSVPPPPPPRPVVVSDSAQSPAVSQADSPERAFPDRPDRVLLTRVLNDLRAL